MSWIIGLLLVFLCFTLNAKLKRLLDYLRIRLNKTSFRLPNEIIVDFTQIPGSKHATIESSLAADQYVRIRHFSIVGQTQLHYYRKPNTPPKNMINLLHNGGLATTAKAQSKIELEGGSYDAAQTNHLVLFPEQRFQFPSNNKFFSDCKSWDEREEGKKHKAPRGRATSTPCVTINPVSYAESSDSLSFQQGTIGQAIRVAVIDSKASFDQFEEFEEPLAPDNLYVKYLSDPSNDFDGRDLVSPRPHGTFMASRIASVYDGSNPLKISNYPFHDGEHGHLMDLLAAFYAAIDSGVRIINMSLGYYSDQADAHLRRAFSYAATKDVLVICSSGNYATNNDNEPFWPANFSLASNVLTVAAVNNGGDYWVGSPDNGNNVGTLVNMSTFGDGVIGFVPSPTGNRVQAMTGTSAAAATLTGYAAQQLSTNPGATASQLKTDMEALISPGGVIYPSPPIPIP